MNERIIQVNNLTKSFGAKRAVDGLSFEVQRGEVFGLLGHNGAGKSTAIDLLLGLKTPDEGISAEICEAVTEAKRGTGKLRFKTLPEISAACIFHRGSYGTLPESYETVLRYIEDNGYGIAGEVRESYIDGVWNKENERDWLSEIQIPVKLQARHCKKG